MSVEDLNNANAGATGAEQTVVDDDAALAAAFDQASADEPDGGQQRGEDGKFKTNGDGDEPDPNDPPQEGEGTGEEGDEAGSSTLTATGAPLPANWNGMDEDWAKIPPDVQAKIAVREQELHTRMSEQGRQIGQYKPLWDVVDQNKDLMEGRKMPDGRDITPAHGVAFLLAAQRAFDDNPIAALLDMADRAGVRQHLAAVLTGQAQIPRTQPQPQQPAVAPADVERIVKEALTEDASAKAANEELSRLSKDKPLYAEIAEEDMVHSIHKARKRLGNAASKEAVFDLAYDIAVNADPDLRAKAAAGKKAAVDNAKRVTDAKRANGVNLTSTQSSKGQSLTEDELLARAYDEIQSKE